MHNKVRAIDRVFKRANIGKYVPKYKVSIEVPKPAQYPKYSDS